MPPFEEVYGFCRVTHHLPVFNTADRTAEIIKGENCMKRKSRFLVLSLLLVLCMTGGLYAQEKAGGNGQLSIFGGLGISSARGAYATEYSADSDFSFFPGLRLRLNELVAPNTFFLVDFGYLETGFIGYVGPTDSYFWRTYEYLNLDVLMGAQAEMFYLAGGIYFANGLNAYDYREYEDKYISLDSNNDFGLLVEAGVELVPFLSLGVQGRYGLKDIAPKVEIKNWAVLGTIAIHFFDF